MSEETVEIPAGPVELEGALSVPDDAAGTVVFAHGSGSSRHSPRNRYVAEALNGAGLGTLLFDLLTPEEEQDRRHVFDIPRLAERLAAATIWLQNRPGPENEWIGYFGASTGAAAALSAATAPGVEVRAIVSRGGRPDLAADDLPNVRTPTLLIVGGRDEEVLELNRRAQRRLGGPSRITVVPGATHLFEEPGALESVAGLAADWFNEHLGANTP
jgi:putative phosphoribosyl transferase